MIRVPESDSVAVLFEDESLTYRELHRRAQEVAERLRRRGIRPGSNIGLKLDRSLELLPTILGIWKAGCAYVPIDRDSLIEDAKISLLITPDGEQPFPHTASTHGLAYILYTSGTTGRPNGVAVEHEAVQNHVEGFVEELNITQNDTLLAIGSLAFDISVTELFAPLVAGAKVALAAPGKDIPREIARFDPDILVATPAKWQHLISSGWRGRADFRAVSAGDALPRPLANQILKRARLWNGYGPTETTAGATYARIEAGDGPIDIGRPLRNVGVHVVDEELYISGPGLALGYWNRPELTAERFLEMPFGRAYRTGDRVGTLPDGRLEFLGRLDDQLKIRGVRVEPGEIESVLQRHPQVREAVVTADAAYIVGEAAESELRTLLEECLPRHLHPARLLYLDEMPLTPRGKVDRRRLRERAREAARVYLAPRTEIETVLGSLFCELLGRERVGRDDNFFHLGGDSLLAARLVARIQDVWSADLSLVSVFHRPTVAALADLIQSSDPAPAIRPSDGPVQLSYAQERIAFLQDFHRSALYHLPIYKTFAEPVDCGRLQAALNEIACRHGVLRAQTIPLTAEHNPEAAFDLTDGPLVRASLEGRELLICVHHIAFDARSAEIFFRELDIFYRRETLPRLAIQYSDFAAWQRDRFNPARDEEYWRTKLAGLRGVLELPTDFPRPAVQTYAAARYRFTYSPPPAGEVATAFTNVLAALHILLSRYTGETDICIGTVVSGRTRPEVRDLIGLFVETLPLRTNIPYDATFAEVREAVRANLLEALDHSGLPFAKIVEAVAPQRSLSHTPLFQVLCTQLDAPPPDVELRTNLTKFDLSLYVEAEALTLEYNSDLFAAATIERMSGHLTTILASGTDLLTARERRQILQEWNATDTAMPEDLALSDASPLNVEPGTAVSLGAERPPELARRIHAIWKARATYVPQSWRADLFRPPAPDPELAYIVHTSGSTGEPKAIGITRRAVINVVTSVRALTNITEEDIFLAVTPLTFDIAALELLLPRNVVVASAEQSRDPRLLLESLINSHATAMQATPATWRMLIDAGWRGAPGFKILCGGEVLPRSLADELLLRGDVWNLYGPTETAIWSTAARVEPGTGPVPIGRPLANTKVFVLDRAQTLLPVGVPGELYIGGIGVSAGYIGQPELTKERFLQHSSFGRLYRTGDRVRWRPDGQLEFIARLDRQIKLRGYRIEPAEIEAAILLHPHVRAAAVILAGDRLVGYHVGAAPNLRRFLAATLPAYMVPSQFIELASFPRTVNGKLDRAALTVPATPVAAQVAPRTAVERRLAEIWETALRRHPIGVTDNFFELGGHSLQAAQLLVHIERQFGRRLTLAALFAAPTIESVAKALRQVDLSGGLAAIRPYGSRTPFFMVEARGMFWPLAESLGEDRPFLGLHWPDPRLLPEPFQVHDIARYFVGLIRERQPAGPYILGGWCVSAAVAFEIAQQLTERGDAVEHLFLFDGVNPEVYPRTPARSIGFLASSARFHLSRMRKLPAREALPYLRKRIQTLRGYAAVGDATRKQFARIENMVSAAVARYRPQPYTGLVTYFERGENAPVNGWCRVVQANLTIHKIPGDHGEMFQSPHVESLGAYVANAIANT